METKTEMISVEVKTTLSQKILKEVIEKVLEEAGIDVVQIQINQIH